MFTKLTTTLFSLTLLAVSSNAQHFADGKTRLFPNGLGVMDTHYKSVVTNTHAGIKSAWPLGSAPAWCVNVANEARSNEDSRVKCELSKLRVWNVTYDDCSQPWEMCRCNDAQLTIDEMVTEFGRIPARMRQLVRHVMAFDASDSNGVPATGCPGAFWWGDNLGFFGKCTGPSVWLHETGHALDQGMPDTGYYQSQLTLDTCIADDYAGSDYWENFAQNVVVLMNKLHAQPLPYNTACMSNVLNVIQNSYRTDMEVQGGNCELQKRRANDPAVAISNNVKRSPRAHAHAPPNGNLTPIDVFIPGYF